MICSECHASVRDASQFCTSCGAPLAHKPGSAEAGHRADDVGAFEGAEPTQESWSGRTAESIARPAEPPPSALMLRPDPDDEFGVSSTKTDMERRFAGAVALLASMLLFLDLFIPPAFRSFDSTRPVWTYSFARFSYLFIRHGHQYFSSRDLEFMWWVLAAVIMGIVTLVVGLASLLRPCRAFGVILIVSSAGTAAAAMIGVRVAHNSQYVGSWGALAAAVIASVAAVGVIVGQRPHRGLASRNIGIVALAGVLAVGVAAIPLMQSGSPNMTYAASEPDQPAPAVTPSEPDVTPDDAASPTPESPAGPLNNTYNFTESETGGYTFQGTLSFGAPEQFQSGITQGDLTAGSACNINAQTDAVIPALLSETNTSSGFNAIVGTELAWDSSAIDGIEIGYKDGPQCEGQSDGESRLNVETTSPSATGSGFSANMFIVVPNYYSPQYPSGNAALLTGVYLQLVEYANSDSNVDIIPQTVSGPGATSTDGLYIPVDADAPAPAPSPTPSDSQGQAFQITGDDVAVRESPTTGSTQTGTLNSGDDVSVLCTAQGDDINGDSLWDQIASPPGYVSDAFVNTNDGEGIPSC